MDRRLSCGLRARIAGQRVGTRRLPAFADSGDAADGHYTPNGDWIGGYWNGCFGERYSIGAEHYGAWRRNGPSACAEG